MSGFVPFVGDVIETNGAAATTPDSQPSDPSVTATPGPQPSGPKGPINGFNDHVLESQQSLVQLTGRDKRPHETITSDDALAPPTYALAIGPQEQPDTPGEETKLYDLMDFDIDPDL